MDSFSSRKYRAFADWQRVVFWLGVLFFIHPVYWLVRLILYLVVKDRPLKERVDFYTQQTYIFGWIVAIMLSFAILVLSVVLVVLLAIGAPPWLA
jgi:cobalamin biosynthesis protein CobD/CbiB